MSDSSSTRAPGEPNLTQPSTIPQKAFQALQGQHMKAFAGIPGPAPSVPLGNAQDFINRLPWEVCAQYAEQYGGMVLIWMLASPTIVLTEPELIWQVMEGDFDNYYKASPGKQFIPLLSGASEFITNGETWKANRAADPAHHAISPRGYEFDIGAIRESISRRARAAIEATRGAPMDDVVPAIIRLTFDVLSIEIVGQELGDTIFNTYWHLAKVGNTRLQAPVSPPFSLATRVALKRWRSRFKALIQEARRDPGAGRSILHATLQAGTRLDDASLAAQLGNFFFGGMTSIASCVIHTLYLLTQHPDMRERVLAEVRARDARPEARGSAAFEAGPELKRAVLESLRLLPPVPIYSRSTVPTREVSLGGHVLPPDTSILITCWPLHRSARHWEEPLRFDPDRWQGRTLEENPLGSGYFFPFGRGRRACAAGAVGLLNIELILESLLATCRPEVGAQQEHEGRFFFGTMFPKGMRARFHPI